MHGGASGAALKQFHTLHRVRRRKRLPSRRRRADHTIRRPFGATGRQALPGVAAGRDTFFLQRVKRAPHQWPVLPIDAQGSSGARAPPFCNSSIEMLSGERTKAMRPSRGGRLMVTPASINSRHLP